MSISPFALPRQEGPAPSQERTDLLCLRFPWRLTKMLQDLACIYPIIKLLDSIYKTPVILSCVLQGTCGFFAIVGTTDHSCSESLQEWKIAE